MRDYIRRKPSVVDLFKKIPNDFLTNDLIFVSQLVCNIFSYFFISHITQKWLKVDSPELVSVWEV